MSFKEYVQYDAVGLADLVRKGEVKPSELVEEAIARITRHNEKINAVICETYEIGRQAASDVENGEINGPFAGVPFLLKDIEGMLTGVPSTFGSRFTKDLVSPIDDELVRRYKQAGMCILGKTNAPELGLLPITEPVAYGASHNPWNLDHSTGGSSGGSGAAVAAGIVPMAHANDGGGSIRIPAACCGVVGMKPTRGRITQGPLMGDAMGGLVNNHVLSRTVRDSAAMLDATAGPMPGDPHTAPAPRGTFLNAAQSSPGKMRIAFCPSTFEGDEIDPEVSSAVLATAKVLEALGHDLVEDYPKDVMQEAMAPFRIVWSTGANLMINAFSQMLGKPINWDEIEPMTRAFYDDGAKYSASDYAGAWNTLHGLSRKVATMLEPYDLLLTPVLTRPPVKLGTFDINGTDLDQMFSDLQGYVPYTALVNATGQPSISLPLHQSAMGLPIGQMFTGKFGDEETLYALAGQLEEALPWKDRHPQVWD